MRQSRLLQRLDAAIASSKLAIDADSFRGERALYLTRLGHRKKAAAAVAELRARYETKPNVKISGWLNLVEGLDIYFADMGPGAHDKVKRSHALSAAAGLKQLQALSAAWLAQLDYMQHDIAEMARHLREALELAEPDNHGAHSRASLVAAQALRHAGREDLATLWHKRAHQHSTKEGDEATLSALLHNMAWLRMLMWRQKTLRGQDESAECRHALMSAESTENFDEMVGSSSLLVLRRLLRAQVLSLQGQPQDALAIYAEQLVDSQKLGASRLQASLLADQAWCYQRLGELENARRYCALSTESITPKTNVDNRAATHSRLAQIYAELGDDDAAKRHGALSDKDWEANDKLQAQVVDLIGDLHGAHAAPAVFKPLPAPTPHAHTVPPPEPASAL